MLMCMITLAYGEFRSLEFWAMLGETLPFFLRLVLLVAVLYGIASVIAECCRWHWIGIPVYVIEICLIAPSLGVMGAWGPAHVALFTGVWAIPIFGIAILAKVVLLYVVRRPPTPNSSPLAMPQLPP